MPLNEDRYRPKVVIQKTTRDPISQREFSHLEDGDIQAREKFTFFTINSSRLIEYFANL